MYQRIHDLYVSVGLTEEEIGGLLVMDIRTHDELEVLRAAHGEQVGTA